MTELNSAATTPLTRPKGKIIQIDFTIENIEAIKPPNDVDRVEYKDTKEQGLYLRVSRSGTKSFTYLGRPKGASKPERQTIGKFPIIKPAQARKLARELAGQQAGGESVTADGRSRREAMTLAELWAKYFGGRAKKKDTETARQAWVLYIEPKFGRRKISDISYGEVERWHKELPSIIVANREAAIKQTYERKLQKAAEVEARRKIRQHGPISQKAIEKPTLPKGVTGETTANRCVETMRAMYNYALHPKRNLFAGQNPAAEQASYKELERSRFIQSDELGKFFMALANLSSESVRDAILTALLAAARKENIISMKWEDLHLDRLEWTLPGEFQKNGEAYVVPLVPELAELLRRRLESHTQHLRAHPPKTPIEKLAAGFVFPSTKSKTGHIVNLAKSWALLKEEAQIENLRIHDLRRTMGSWQAKTGATLVVIGKSLNHKDSAATAIYARLDMDPVRDSMTTAASAMFEAAGLKSKGEVIALPRHKMLKKNTG